MIDVIGTIGPPQAPRRLLLVYTGGTIGMTDGPSGLVPLDLEDLAGYVPTASDLPVLVTLASAHVPIDSSAIRPAHWLQIADAIADHSPGHLGVVVLHGTDTMAYTASALSFLLTDIDVPVVLTGSQRPITAVRSDARENLVTAAAIALERDKGVAVVPEVSIVFDHVVLRGNRASKVHADHYHGFDSPNLSPLAHAGATIEFNRSLIRPAGDGPIRRQGGLCPDVTSIRLHPALDASGLAAALSRPGLRGAVLESYGSGNGPSEPEFLDVLCGATEDGIVIVATTQCRAGRVRDGHYALGTALMQTGVIPGGDLTFEAALTKLMVLLDADDNEEVKQKMTIDLAGELTSSPS